MSIFVASTYTGTTTAAGTWFGSGSFSSTSFTVERNSLSYAFVVSAGQLTLPAGNYLYEIDGNLSIALANTVFTTLNAGYRIGSSPVLAGTNPIGFAQAPISGSDYLPLASQQTIEPAIQAFTNPTGATLTIHRLEFRVWKIT